jgi:hypothetical protein
MGKHLTSVLLQSCREAEQVSARQKLCKLKFWFARQRSHIRPFMDVDYMVYQPKYDSVHKRYPGTVCSKKDGDKVYLVVNGSEVQVFNSKDLTTIP